MSKAKASANDKKTQEAETAGDKSTEAAAQEHEEASSVDQDSLADDWAAAMAEQVPEQPEQQADNGATGSAGSQENAPGDELNEPAGASSGGGNAGSRAEAAGDQVFKPLEKDSGDRSTTRDLEMVMDIPVKLNVELGRTRITIKELLELSEGSVVELDGLAGDPMDILINGYLVAQGEVVVVDDKYGIRITEIITPSERINKLNR